MSDLTIRPGDSFAISLSLKPKQDMTGWSCRVMIKTALSAAADIDKTISTVSADTFTLSGLVTNTETATLNVRSYHLLLELTDGSDQSREEHLTIDVLKQGVP